MCLHMPAPPEFLSTVPAEEALPCPAPFFHSDSDSVRFWVQVHGLPVGATISRATLHYRFCAQQASDQPLTTYLAHAAEVDSAVRRRVLGGSIEPVMLREHDLLPVPVSSGSQAPGA
jgi:hypothetical protein